MAITKRGKSYHIRFRPFGREVIGVKTPVRTKTEARQLETVLLTACRSGDYSGLDPSSREVCVRMFKNQGWQLPPELDQIEPVIELTLWSAAEIFLKYPEISECPTRWRYEVSLVHLAEKLGKETPLKSIWVPTLKKYQIDRVHEKAAPGTVNWELSTLSKLFSVMIELRLMETNPVRLVKKLSAAAGERQAYVGHEDFQKLLSHCPLWFHPIALTAYYTGMRRGELLGLTRSSVNLFKRIILLGPADTKEGHWKRVPIHRDLVSILEQCIKVSSLDSGALFLLRDEKGIRVPSLEGFKNCWPRALEAIDRDLKKRAIAGEAVTPWPKPWPRFHDLRHTWKTNARRSGMDPEIRESILGHWFREKSVAERYGRISDEELVRAIDQMTFDHGRTEIYVARR